MVNGDNLINNDDIDLNMPFPFSQVPTYYIKILQIVKKIIRNLNDIEFRRTFFRVCNYLDVDNRSSADTINKCANSEGLALGLHPIFPKLCDAARRILSYDPSTFYSPIVDLPVADTNITIRFTLSQFKQYNGLKDYIALKISILSRPDALLLCNKPKCGSLHDMTDGAAHQEWIKF